MNILLTSAGRRTYLIDYFKQAIGDEGLVYASNSVLTYTLLQADKYVITPAIYDEGYIDFLINYCKEENISVIISLFDIDLPVLAKHRLDFKKNGIDVIVSDENVTNICNDKWLTYQFLKEIGIPQVYTCASYETAKDAIEAGELKFPVILKPRWGMGSIGIYQVDNESELSVLYDKLKRDIFNTYLKFESNADPEFCILIQEKIVGQEYGIEVLNDLEGNYVTTVAKKKIAMRSGETDVAEIVDNSAFVPIASLISQRLKHIANLDVDCFVAGDNTVYVLEMNCRFGGQYPFSHLSGVNFPRQIIQWVKGKKTDWSLITPKVGTVGCKDITPVVFGAGK